MSNPELQEITKLIDLGTFIISQSALNELVKFKEKFTHRASYRKDISVDYVRAYVSDLKLVSSCIEKIKKMGKKT